MTTTEFKNEWIGFSTPEIEEQFDIDLNTLINDEIERRMESIGKDQINKILKNHTLHIINDADKTNEQLIGVMIRVNNTESVFHDKISKPKPTDEEIERASRIYLMNIPMDGTPYTREDVDLAYQAGAKDCRDGNVKPKN